MKRRAYKFSALVLLLFTSSCAWEQPKTITVYYVPFHLVTYTAITAEIIECRASETWRFDENDAYGKEFLSLAQDKKVEVAPLIIRARIISSQRPIDIDARGHASNGREAFFFDPEAVRQFRQRLPERYIQQGGRKGC